MTVIAAIATIDKPDTPFQSEQFGDEADAKAWLRYQIPSLPIEKLKINSRLSYADTYSVSLKADESLPEVIDVEAEEVPAKSRKKAEPVEES